MVLPDLLIISGSMGAGKTTLMAEASDLLTAAGQFHAAIDMDAVAMGHFPGTASALQTQNLAAVWRGYAELRVPRVLIAAAIDSAERLDQIRSAIPAARVQICRLRAGAATMERRIRVREPGLLQQELVQRIGVLEAAINAAALVDFEIDNDDRSITSAARELLHRAGWLQGA